MFRFSPPGAGEGSGCGGTSSNCRYLGSACQKILTQLDLRFCENEGSKRFKINEKKGKLDRKFRENLYKMLQIRWKIRQTLGLSISGTKCDRDKPIFSAEREGQSDCVEV